MMRSKDQHHHCLLPILSLSPICVQSELSKCNANILIYGKHNEIKLFFAFALFSYNGVHIQVMSTTAC